MLRTHRAGKGPGGCGGWGLGSTEQKGPRRAPHPWSQRAGHSPGSPAGFLGSSGWGKHPRLLSCSSSSGGPFPRASPVLPWPPSYAPRTHAACRGLWRTGYQPGNSAVSPARVGRANALCSSPVPLGRPPLPASPDQPGLRDADPVWPPLLLPP